jgi:hypothetical protein
MQTQEAIGVPSVHVPKRNVQAPPSSSFNCPNTQQKRFVLGRLEQILVSRFVVDHMKTTKMIFVKQDTKYARTFFTVDEGRWKYYFIHNLEQNIALFVARPWEAR